MVVAGSVRDRANVGILSAADNSKIGQLSAAGDLASTPDTQVVDVYVDDSATTTTTAAP